MSYAKFYICSTWSSNFFLAIQSYLKTNWLWFLMKRCDWKKRDRNEKSVKHGWHAISFAEDAFWSLNKSRKLYNFSTSIFFQFNFGTKVYFCYCLVPSIVIKPGRARQVDPMAGPIWLRQKIRMRKNPAKPGWPAGLSRNPGDPEKPGWKPFFSNVFFLLARDPFLIYFLVGY
jgi:hypothetical protein